MKFLTFQNGDKMPIIGLGTWKSASGEVYNAVRKQLKLNIVILTALICTATNLLNESTSLCTARLLLFECSQFVVLLLSILSDTLLHVPVNPN